MIVHRNLLLLGALLVMTGLILTYVPLFAGPSEVLTTSHPTAAFNATTTLSLTPDWTVALTWSSAQRVSLLVVVCNSLNPTAGSSATACPGATITVLNGTSGAATFSVPVRGTLLVGIVSTLGGGASVDVHLKPTLIAIGAVLVIGGAAVCASGVYLWWKRRASAPSPSGGTNARDP